MNSNFLRGQAFLTAAYGRLGMDEEATWQVEEIRHIHPAFSISYWVRTEPFRNEEAMAPFVEGLRLAGLPD